MKKIVLVAIVVCALLLLTACASEPHYEPIAESEVQHKAPTNDASVQIHDAGNPDIPYGDEKIEWIHITASWPDYTCIDELASNAVHVVRVEVLDERPEWINPFLRAPIEGPIYELYTINQVRVLEVFQGDAQPGDIMDVGQRGGQFDNMRVTTDAKVPFVVGEELVLFLGSSGSNTNFNGEQLPAFLLTPWASVYRVPSFGEELSALSVNQQLEAVDSRCRITLTIGDLRQIADGTLGNNSR